MNKFIELIIVYRFLFILSPYTSELIFLYSLWVVLSYPRRSPGRNELQKNPFVVWRENWLAKSS